MYIFTSEIFFKMSETSKGICQNEKQPQRTLKKDLQKAAKKMNEGVETIKERSQATTESLKEKTQATAGSLKEKTQEVTRQAAETTGSWWGYACDNASWAWENTKCGACRAYNYVFTGWDKTADDKSD